jgi:hypothetical protein
MTKAPLAVSPNDRMASRANLLALVFLLACALLAVPLLFSSRVPPIALVVTLAALLMTFAIRAVLTRTLVPRTAVDWTNLLTLLLLPLSLWASADPAVSWPGAIRIQAGFALFYGLAGLAGTRWMRLLPWVMLAFTAGLALVMLVGTRWSGQKVPFLPPSIYQLLPTIYLPWQPTGTSSNLTGSAMAFLLMPALAVAWWGRGRALRLVALATALLTGFVLLLTQSRGAWIATLVAFLVMAWLHYQKKWSRGLRFAVLILVTALVVLAWTLSLIWLGSSLDASSAAGSNEIMTLTGRMELWSRALYMIQDFSFTGVGPGMFEPVVMILYPPFFTGVQTGFTHAHNVFLHYGAEYGIPGLIAHLALLLGLAASLIMATTRPASFQGLMPLGTMPALAIGLFGSLMVYVVHGLTDAPFVFARGYALGFAVFGAAAAVTNHLLTPGETESSQAG